MLKRNKKDRYLIIFGENHSSLKEIKYINNQIKSLKPDYVLHELLYEDQILNRKIALSRLKNCKIGNLCDPTLNKDLYKLAYNLNIPFIGIDTEQNKLINTIKENFQYRENHMVKMINKYKKKGNIIVVVGDTHLRTIKTKQLGDVSPIIKKFGKEATIIRSKYKEIE